jgi:uncharacterized LabA/DUF88 family protein
MKQKRQKVYAFVDSQNLNLGLLYDIKNKKGKTIYKGWKLDFKKFRVYLSDKFRASKAFLFIGYTKEHQYLYRSLKRYGYELIFKPTTKDGSGNLKGNIDAELVLHAAAIEFGKYDKAVIASGDGDFRCLHEYLVKKGKLKNIIVPNKLSASSLLKDFEKYKIFIEYEKEKLEHKK